MTEIQRHPLGVTIPKWLRVDLSVTEAAIIIVAVLACVSALVELVRGIW
jgi:hypothetical protein